MNEATCVTLKPLSSVGAAGRDGSSQPHKFRVMYGKIPRKFRPEARCISFAVKYWTSAKSNKQNVQGYEVATLGADIELPSELLSSKNPRKSQPSSTRAFEIHV